MELIKQKYIALLKEVKIDIEKTAIQTVEFHVLSIKKNIYTSIVKDLESL
jgi:hypothetical protein